MFLLITHNHNKNAAKHDNISIHTGTPIRPKGRGLSAQRIREFAPAGYAAARVGNPVER